MSELYWNMFSQTKFSYYYYLVYGEQARLMKFFINIALAIVSSSSIATWAIWQEYQFVWATIIAFSQVIAVVSQYLPYAKQASVAPYLQSEYDAILIEIEYSLLEVNTGMEDDEVAKLIRKFVTARSAIENKYGVSEIFPFSTFIQKKAQKPCGEFFSQSFHMWGEVKKNE